MPPKVSIYPMDHLRSAPLGVDRTIPLSHTELHQESGSTRRQACKHALRAAVSSGRIREAGDYLCVVIYSDQSSAAIILTVEPLPPVPPTPKLVVR